MAKKTKKSVAPKPGKPGKAAPKKGMPMPGKAPLY